jgi:hypothetical protein
MFFVQKSQVTLNEFELDSIDIMCSSIIEKYINFHHQYEFLSLTKFSFLNNISKHHKPKIISFVNYNKKILRIG